MAKITRQTQKIFANSATNNGVFGSGQAGTKVLSNSLATLMGLAAFNTGWNDAVLGTKKFPPLEEIQALDYINTYQLSYLFQEGCPEYDAGTTYFLYSWVKKAGTNQIYSSLADTNLGNALTDVTKWKKIFDGDATAAPNLIFNYAADTGTQNHIATAPNPAVSSYVAGDVVFVIPAFSITGACDIDVNAKGVKSIKLSNGNNPTTGMMLSTGAYALMYDGTNFVLLNPTLTVADASETVKGIVELATTAETGAGTDAARAVTPSGMKNSLGFSKYFESSEITFTTSYAEGSYSSGSVNHWLGVIPALYSLDLICTSAEGGYSIGDVIRPKDFSRDDQGWGVWCSATEIGWSNQCGYYGYRQLTKTGSSWFTPSPSSWKVKLRAWA